MTEKKIYQIVANDEIVHLGELKNNSIEIHCIYVYILRIRQNIWLFLKNILDMMYET